MFKILQLARRRVRIKRENYRDFNNNRQVYGTRKIKRDQAKSGLTVSRRRIGRLMGKESDISRRINPSVNSKKHPMPYIY